jgi:hypothetical protein
MRVLILLSVCLACNHIFYLRLLINFAGGRVADASPVIGIAWWWHGWLETDFDQLAAALVAGHLIECSSYLTGSNFCNFFQYKQEDLCFVGPPIAEVAEDGTIIVTKHESFKGYVTEDIVKCQLLYELQGSIYLNSDVTADLASVSVMQVSENRYDFQIVSCTYMQLSAANNVLQSSSHWRQRFATSTDDEICHLLPWRLAVGVLDVRYRLCNETEV